MTNQVKRQVLTVVMDGIGVRQERFGNAVALAHTPYFNFLKKHGLYTSLQAHGTYVGLPSDQDIGNSEVGHNALGAGRVFDQGAKLVQNAIESGRIFAGPTWQEIIRRAHGGACLHFLGLLSNGNVHSHEEHLYSLMRQACRQGVKKIRLHLLFDGRDVPEKSAEVYVERLEQVLAEIQAGGCDAQVASGGGRMLITMDRYEADWAMVERGWKVHVLGQGPGYRSLGQALAEFRQDPGLVDQYLPEFVIKDQRGQSVGPIEDGDAVVFFNFRGDRAIEISRAFEEKDFDKFDRQRWPEVYYAGMTEYDGDLHIPQRFLVTPPQIDDTLGEHLAGLGLRQFACSETQKFGHVTYFWNGNRSGYLDRNLEEYLEIPSDLISFDRKPWMKAYEITEETIARMLSASFDCGRINYPNGDMVGHTGNLEAAVIAVSIVDMMLGRLIEASRKSKTILLITADHGNCDEMFDAKPQEFPNWEELSRLDQVRPKPKTAHTLAQVPFYLYDPCGIDSQLRLKAPGEAGLAAVANTTLELLGLPQRSLYETSLIQRR